MDQRKEDFRISKGRHVQLESELLSKMQRRLIGSAHERIERIMTEHRRALFLQMNGPNSAWRLGEVKDVKEETEHVDRRVSQCVPEQVSGATGKAEFSIRRDILPSAQTHKSRGSQSYLRGSQSGRSRGHRTYNPSSRFEIENKNADTCEKSNSSPKFGETNERKMLKNNEYSAASGNDNELGPDMQELNGMIDLEKSSSPQKAEENNVIDVKLETDVEKNDDICAFEGKSTKGDKRGNMDNGDGLDQNHDLVSQGAEIYTLSLQNEKPLLHSQGNIVHKVIADDTDWAQASPPLTSIHDKFLKTNRFFAISRRKSNSNPQISETIPETQPADGIKPTVLSNNSNTDSSTTQQRDVLLRDTSMLTKYEPKEESKGDVLSRVETVPKGRKITFQDDLHQSEPLASEIIEKDPSSRTHVIHSTKCKKSDKNATTRQLAFSTRVKVENGPLQTGRFSFKGKGVTMPQATDKRKSESFPPQLCSKNAWAPKVSITWEENEPTRVRLLPAEGSIRQRLTFREHKDLWPHVKIVVILRMLDGEHYYREIKR